MPTTAEGSAKNGKFSLLYSSFIRFLKRAIKPSKMVFCTERRSCFPCHTFLKTCICMFTKPFMFMTDICQLGTVFPKLFSVFQNRKTIKSSGNWALSEQTTINFSLVVLTNNLIFKTNEDTRRPLKCTINNHH